MAVKMAFLRKPFITPITLVRLLARLKPHLNLGAQFVLFLHEGVVLEMYITIHIASGVVEQLWPIEARLGYFVNLVGVLWVRFSHDGGVAGYSYTRPNVLSSYSPLRLVGSSPT